MHHLQLKQYLCQQYQPLIQGGFFLILLSQPLLEIVCRVTLVVIIRVIFCSCSHPFIRNIMAVSGLNLFQDLFNTDAFD